MKTATTGQIIHLVPGVPPSFIGEDGQVVSVPMESNLSFPHGFLVRERGGDHAGSYGSPDYPYAAKIIKKGEEVGLLLPGKHEEETFWGKIWRVIRRQKQLEGQFIPLSAVRAPGERPAGAPVEVKIEN